MNYVLLSLAFTSFLYLVGGGPGLENDLVRTSYESHMEDLEVLYSIIEENGMKCDRVDVCTKLAININELNYIGLEKLEINSQIRRGVFNNNEGFILILQDNNTIDIPAVIECNTRRKIDDEELVIGGKAFVYYYIIYKNRRNNFTFARVERYHKKISESDKLVFRLKTMDTIGDYLETYKNRNTRRPVEKWFKKAKNHKNMAKKKCEEVAFLSKAAEQNAAEWETVNGTAITGEFYLLLTETTEVQLIGIIKCEVKLKNSTLNDIKVKYYTLTNDKGEEGSSFIHGPVIINEKQTFTVSDEMCELLKEVSRKVKT